MAFVKGTIFYYNWRVREGKDAIFHYNWRVRGGKAAWIACHLPDGALERFNATAKKVPHMLLTTCKEYKTYFITSYGLKHEDVNDTEIIEIKFASNFRAVVEKLEDAQSTRRRVAGTTACKFIY